MVSPFVFGSAVRARITSVALSWDNGLDIGAGDLLANGVSVIALVGGKSLDPDGDHPEQWREAVGAVRLPGRQDEAERAAFGVASWRGA